ncbi:MAG TPA: CDP-alcohol phosphatidyltransferase family protein [Thermoleophilia bacterium]|nr:CDP-alcohol phosphatidyltransferase family protein [Thermoleophilia bacterium]
MSAEQSRIQALFDRAIQRTLLWAVPGTVRPNHLTLLRFLLVPAVFLLFRAGSTEAALAVFVVGASTDFMDGAMARTRGQVTELGTFIDPLADKLLVASALLALGSDYLVIRVIVASIGLELVLMAAGAAHWARGGKVVRANVFGKIKMVLLSVGIALFLLGQGLAEESLVRPAVWLLWAALAFAAASGIKFVRENRAAVPLPPKAPRSDSAGG